MTYRKQVERNMHLCPACGQHYRIGADDRIAQLVEGRYQNEWVLTFTGPDPANLTPTRPGEPDRQGVLTGLAETYPHHSMRSLQASL